MKMKKINSGWKRKIKSKSQRAGALIFVLGAIAIVAVLMGYMFKSSQNDLAQKKQEAEQKAARLALLGQFEKVSSLFRAAVANCLVDSGSSDSSADMITPTGAESCPVSIQSIGTQAGIQASQELEIVCGGQRRGSDVQSGCTRDQSYLPKQFGITLAEVTNGKYQKLRATVEIGFPEVKDFARLYTNIGYDHGPDSGIPRLTDLTLAPTNAKMVGLFFNPDLVTGTTDSDPDTRGGEVHFVVGSSTIDDLVTNLPASNMQQGSAGCAENANYDSSCLPTISTQSGGSVNVTGKINYFVDTPNLRQSFQSRFDETRTNATHDFSDLTRVNGDRVVNLSFALDSHTNECVGTIWEYSTLTTTQYGGHTQSTNNSHP